MIRHSEKSLMENKTVGANSGMSSAASTFVSSSNASGASSATSQDVNSNPLSESGNAASTNATTSGSAIPNTTSAYTLYLEHLGGFLPILKGKRVSKIRPEFIIYDPQLPGKFMPGIFFSIISNVQDISIWQTLFS